MADKILLPVLKASCGGGCLLFHPMSNCLKYGPLKRRQEADGLYTFEPHDQCLADRETARLMQEVWELMQEYQDIVSSVMRAHPGESLYSQFDEIGHRERDILRKVKAAITRFRQARPCAPVAPGMVCHPVGSPSPGPSLITTDAPDREYYRLEGGPHEDDTRS